MTPVQLLVKSLKQVKEKIVSRTEWGGRERGRGRETKRERENCWNRIASEKLI